jgi:hypothetical protein
MTLCVRVIWSRSDQDEADHDRLSSDLSMISAARPFALCREETGFRISGHATGRGGMIQRVACVSERARRVATNYGALLALPAR